MKCIECGRNMRKTARRKELAEMDDGASDGQISDYLAAELSGNAGSWSLAIIEYFCANCDSFFQIVNDELPNYYPLINAWHEKAGSGDCFANFVFEYLSFIAHIRNNLFFDSPSDRSAIQRLKRDERIKLGYLGVLEKNRRTRDAWTEIIEELANNPLHNSSEDLDNPEIEKWWNNSDFRPDKKNSGQEGKVLSLDDWQNMVEFWYSIRNNLFHGGKNPNIKRDVFLVSSALNTLRPLMDFELSTKFPA